MTPTLTYPSTVLIRVIPAAVIEITINKRVLLVTGIDNPVRMPFETVPNERIPVSGEAKVTAVPAIGENVLSSVGDEYNWAVTVTVDPTKLNATVVLKYAAIDVIVPSRGAEKAILRPIPGSSSKIDITTKGS